MALSRAAQEALGHLATFGMRPGLESTQRLLRALGDPQEDLPTVLVAGTNGKGTTSALLAAMATAAGYRTGLFTSPHLESVEERIRIDGEAVPGGELSETLLEVVAAAEVLEGPLTFFEALTATALLLFVRRNVQLAIIEVGLGGRLDATNVCSPSLSLVTSIAVDHRRHLGGTVAEIAVEKAGILRAERPAVAALEGEALRAVQAVADERKSRLITVGRRLLRSRAQPLGGASQMVEMTTTEASYELRLNLLGRHQIDNLALAVVAAEELSDLGFALLDQAAILRGVASCTWPGRLERIELPRDRVVLLDGAHNPEAARALRDALTAIGDRWTLVFGVLEDKEVEGMLPLLVEVVDRVVLTRPGGSRGRSPESYGELWQTSARVRMIEDAAMALERALGPSQAHVVVAGSLHLVGELRLHLRRRFGVPAPATDALFRSPVQENSS